MGGGKVRLGGSVVPGPVAVQPGQEVPVRYERFEVIREHHDL